MRAPSPGLPADAVGGQWPSSGWCPPVRPGAMCLTCCVLPYPGDLEPPNGLLLARLETTFPLPYAPFFPFQPPVCDQTLMVSVGRRTPVITFRREELEMGDGGVVTLDWDIDYAERFSGRCFCGGKGGEGALMRRRRCFSRSGVCGGRRAAWDCTQAGVQRMDGRCEQKGLHRHSLARWQSRSFTFTCASLSRAQPRRQR